MKKRMILFMILILIVTLCSCGKKKIDTNENIEYTVKVKFNNTEYSVRYENEILKYYEDNKFIKNIDNKYYKGAIKEVNFDVPEDKLEENIAITDRVYNANIDESIGYLKWLENHKYTKVFEAYTHDYLEFYLLSEDQTYQRLIITDKYIVISILENIPEFKIENYLYD